MPISLRRILIIFFVVTVGATMGCSTFNPIPVDEPSFMERARTKFENNIQVTAAVPSAEETKQLLGVNLYKRDIQPIWLEIKNTDEESVWYLPLGTDTEYYDPLEAAHLNRFTSSKQNTKMNRYFYERGIGIHIGPNETRSGYIFTTLDEGTKGFNVDLIGEDQQLRTFTFFIPVPGLRTDHSEVDWQTLFSADEIIAYDEEGLRKALENLPCCTTNESGTNKGDPLNMIIIGDGEDVFHAFIAAGWDETETVYAASAWKTTTSFLFGSSYRYSPLSSLYTYGRAQDISFQKARSNIHERNHFRLWLSPMRYEGKPVWVGQISRDIGVRWTWQTITTHKIDPDVDETRNFILQDLWYAQALEKFAFVKGVGAADIHEPRGNLTGDPYFTDGNRIVLWVSSQPIDFEEVENARWEIPSQHEASRR